MTVTAPSDHVRVPSWRVDEAMLAAWGFPVERRDHVVGMGFVAEAGMRFEVAMTAAWAAGFVRMAGTPDWRRVEARREHKVKMATMRRNASESLAFFSSPT